MAADPGSDVRRAEAALVEAQRAQDVDALDALLHDELVWTGPDGSVGGKADDLQAHRDRVFVIHELEVRELHVDIEASDMAVTRALVEITGEPISGTVRYTRVWVRDGDAWTVRVAHVGLVQ